jgi:hypothetical protein
MEVLLGDNSDHVLLLLLLLPVLLLAWLVVTVLLDEFPMMIQRLVVGSSPTVAVRNKKSQKTR